ncbi:hypothetical protein POTOM_034015 [Populus tomentosa]|uniref:Secreted protein n=1 Tax=Populus tomentosa TaxID=118781 RepID=A0A8X7Z4K1_POPTO|nr:hypothetical protein POTOM_034015 [Populus tomentosa]
MLPFKPKMRRLTFTIHLLLALLLLVASQQHFPSTIKVQAMEAGKKHPSSPLLLLLYSLIIHCQNPIAIQQWVRHNSPRNQLTAAN